MRVAVKDANIFIDLESMGILDLWFQLKYTTMTSSFVVVELEAGGHANALASINAGQVQEAVIAAEEMERFDAMFQACQPRGLSLADVSVLFLALREDAILLTGDKPMRQEANVRTVEVHGTLWILDQLISAGLLAPPLAAQRLEALIQRTGREQRFLPKSECLSRISRWIRS